MDKTQRNSLIKSLAPWAGYLLGYVLPAIDSSLTFGYVFWLAGLVCSIVFLTTDKRNGKFKPEHIVAMVVGIIGVVLAIIAVIIALLFVGSLLNGFFSLFHS